MNRIDSRFSPYSSQEYLNAIHNPSYRDVKNKMVVKHPSEWYHKKETSIWQSFLNKLTSDAPEWREYCESYLEKMVWMQDVSKLKLGSSLWHMHPVMFLGVLSNCEGMITYEQLKAILPADRENEVKVYLEPLNKTMKLFEINTPLRKAHFMAQILHETGFFKYTEETA